MTDQEKVEKIVKSQLYGFYAKFTNGRGKPFVNTSKKCSDDTYNNPSTENMRTTNWDAQYTEHARRGWKRFRVKSPTLCCLCFKTRPQP